MVIDVEELDDIILKPKELARKIEDILLHTQDPVVSDNPFKWTGSDIKCVERKRLLHEVEGYLKRFRLDAPKPKPKSFSGRIGSIFSGVVSFFRGTPSISVSLALGLYTVPRGWSFSQINTEQVWDVYRKKFPYFDTGDENQCIGTRIWGFTDQERKLPFQLFHFHYHTVYYIPVTISTGKTTTTIMQRVSDPHDRYGAFISFPESRTRFRVTEIGGDAGLDKQVKLAYHELNKAVDIYCEPKDELSVTQFLSPVVQEAILDLSRQIPDMLIDFYNGYVFLATSQDPFEDIEKLPLDENAPHYQKILSPGIDRLDAFLNLLRESFGRIKKYNDNY